MTGATASNSLFLPCRPSCLAGLPTANELRFAPGKPWRMYLVSAEGRRPEPLLEEQHNEIDPNWSPDGNSLAFAYAPWLETEASGIVAVYVLELRTHKLAKLPGSEGLFAPRWSPDGRYIVAMPSDNQSLMLFEFRTQRWVELAKVAITGPSNLSRDGQYVQFLGSGREPAICRVRVSDHRLEEVVSLKGIRQAGWAGGIWTGLAPDGSPLVLRDIGMQEIYALDWQAVMPGSEGIGLNKLAPRSTLGTSPAGRS